MNEEVLEIPDRRVDHSDGWSMRFFAALPPSHEVRTGFAELYRDDKLVCRITVAQTFTRYDAMLDALHNRGLEWIADWKSRDHTGNTDFAEL